MLRRVSRRFTYAISWQEPPAASICLRAEAENFAACTVSFLESLPSPRTLMPSFCPLTRPALRRAASSTVAPLSKRSRSETFTTACSFLKMLVKPRLGRRRCSGICPPSNPRMREKPERDFCPFSPRAAVLPWPYPGPRPTRFFAWRAPFFGFRLLSSMSFLSCALRVARCESRNPQLGTRNGSFDDFHQMRDLGNHAADVRRVRTLGHAVHLAQAEGLERLAHLARAADAAAHLAHAEDLLLLGLLLRRAHAAPSSSPRSDWYCFSLRSCWSASKVALTTLCGLAVPRDLVRMFWMPADSRMARTGPPAMTPVPSEAGLSSTLPAP